MKIKSAKSFRQWYKNLIPVRKHAAQYWDENFMGVQHKDLSGFLAMYHGDKEDIYGFLRKKLKWRKTVKLFMNLFRMQQTAVLQNSICFIN